MKIILENFNYRGMHFDKYELDLSELGDVYDDTCQESLITRIFEIINKDLDKRLWKEVNSRT